MTEEVNDAGRNYLVELYDRLTLAELIELERRVHATRVRATRLLDIHVRSSRDWLAELREIVCELCHAIQVKSDLGHALAAQASAQEGPPPADAWRAVRHVRPTGQGNVTEVSYISPDPELAGFVIWKEPARGWTCPWRVYTFSLELVGHTGTETVDALVGKLRRGDADADAVLSGRAATLAGAKSEARKRADFLKDAAS